MAGYCEILFHTHSAGTIRLDAEPLARRGRAHARRPNHGFTGDAFPCYDDAVGVDLINTVSEPDLDTQAFEPLLCRTGKFLTKRR